jgi:hypothetical protein
MLHDGSRFGHLAFLASGVILVLAGPPQPSLLLPPLSHLNPPQFVLLFFCVPCVPRIFASLE